MFFVFFFLRAETGRKWRRAGKGCWEEAGWTLRAGSPRLSRRGGAGPLVPRGSQVAEGGRRPGGAGALNLPHGGKRNPAAGPKPFLARPASTGQGLLTRSAK